MDMSEEMDPANFCAYSDEQMKEFWCRHLKDDAEFLGVLKKEHLLNSYCYNVSSNTEECLMDNYENSSIKECDEDR